MINPHQIESSDCVFSQQKHFDSDFWKFYGNRQTEFENLKFKVCVNTHQIWTREMYFVYFPQNFQKSESKFFSCQNTKSELSIDGLIIYVSFSNFNVGEPQNIFVKILENPTLSALLNFVSLYLDCVTCSAPMPVRFWI